MTSDSRRQDVAALNATDWDKLEARIRRDFDLNPVDSELFFAGRAHELQECCEAISSLDRQLIVFGEIGIGKTSLANILTSRFAAWSPHTAICLESDTFSSLWRRLLAPLQIADQPIGYAPQVIPRPVSERLPEQWTPDVVLNLLANMARMSPRLFVLDEFHRLTDGQCVSAMTDTVKYLCTKGIPAKLLIVGVADDVGRLLDNNLAINRSLAKVRMPRMRKYELQEIVEQRLRFLNMDMPSDLLLQIVVLSQGTPIYTRRLAQAACLNAIAGRTTTVSSRSVDAAILAVCNDTDMTFALELAVRRLGTNGHAVPAACASARVDRFGYFNVADVVDALGAQPGVVVDSNVAGAVEVLREVGILIGKDGRYCFKDPLLQPVLCVEGFAQGRLTLDRLAQTLPIDLPKVLGDGEETARGLIEDGHRHDLSLTGNAKYRRLTRILEELERHVPAAVSGSLLGQTDRDRFSKLKHQVQAIDGLADESAT